MCRLATLSAFVLLVGSAHGFLAPSPGKTESRLLATDNRRAFLTNMAIGGASLLLPGSPASASIYLDPAMYGDQELRVAAVDSLRERVRQAILQDPSLAPSFYQLALLDGLSYSTSSKEFGPDGSIVISVLSSKNTDQYTINLQKACKVLIDAGVALKKYTAITIGDSVAISGAEAVHSIGGPIFTVQLGRMEPNKKNKPPTLDYNLLNGQASPAEINAAFKSAGLTEREMTALLGALLTLETVDKDAGSGNWKTSARPKFRERGKMGRMSEFKRLTDEDIAQMEADYDEGLTDPDDNDYIVDSFGSRDTVFGATVSSEEISEKTFNKFLQEVNTIAKKGKGDGSSNWISAVLLDPNNPPVQAWLSKYAGSNLTYLKDLGIAFNSMSQLGAEYTGGKYESLLKNKPRKSLNNDDMNLF